jgi:hypothetical protein
MMYGTILTEINLPEITDEKHNSEVYAMINQIQMVKETFRDLSKNELLTSEALVALSKLEHCSYTLLK